MSFLTVEDINGTIYANQGFYWHKIDTSQISETEDFEDIAYDFVKVSRTTENGNITYRFKIDNNYWTTSYYITSKSGEYLQVNLTNMGGAYGFTTTESSVVLFLQLGYASRIASERIAYTFQFNEISMYYSELKDTHMLNVVNLQSQTIERLPFSNLYKGLNVLEFQPLSSQFDYLYVNIFKTNFKFNCNATLTVGKVNTVKLGADSRYKPNGAMIGEYTPVISVEYNGQTIDAEWDADYNDYIFEIDLTDKRNLSNIRFKVNIKSNEVVNATQTTVILKTEYETISNFVALQDACAENGIEILMIDSDITFNSTIQVEHSIKIIGTNNTFNLNNHSFNLLEGIEFNAENLQFNVGDTSIIQQKNSKVKLTNCSFTNCTSSNYNGLGSCIFCDTDLDNLDNPDDFETVLIDCTFTDNQSCIFHNGKLTVNNCKMYNTDTDYVDINNVAFLYQTDGNATITNSTFDIDYDTDEFCSNETNLGFAQCIVKIGETATINGANYLDLENDNTLPLFNQDTNNQAHLFAKYYYPKAFACVYASPIENYENKSCCHCVSGVDWIFKNNVQITRNEWNSQNTKRIIEWRN